MFFHLTIAIHCSFIVCRITFSQKEVLLQSFKKVHYKCTSVQITKCTTHLQSTRCTTYILFRQQAVSLKGTKCTTHVLFRQQTVSAQSTRCTTPCMRRVWRFLPKLITSAEYTGKYSGIQYTGKYSSIQYTGKYSGIQYTG